MKSMKTQLLLTILCVVFGCSLIIFFITFSQFMHQKQMIGNQGGKQAKKLSQRTGEKLEQLNEQVAMDFASACSRYFDVRFASVRKHVEAIQKNMEQLYRDGNTQGDMDEQVGLVHGVSPDAVLEEFQKVSSIREFIKYMPEYDAKNIRRLDLYVMTESGMCLDGTESALGSDYMDLRKEDWYRQAKKRKDSDGAYWSGIFTGKVTKKTKVICAMPIRDENGICRGCAAGDMEDTEFKKILEEFQEEQITSVVFFDSAGEFMYATNQSVDENQIKSYLGKREVVAVEDEIYAYAKLQETGWTICLVLNQQSIREITRKLQEDVGENVKGITDIVQKSIRKTIITVGGSMVVIVLVSVILSNFLAGGFVRPIRQLMSQVKQVGSGNLNQVITVKSKNEIGQLAYAFQNMTEELKTYVAHIQGMTAQEERMTAQLQIARQIQMNMLPKQFPAFSGREDFDIYGSAHPSDSGGGNFYDFFMVDKDHLCMAVGDVTGTGIPSTLFSVITRTHIKNYARLGYGPERILAETNNQLSYKNDAGLTVSVFVGIMDLQTGMLSCCNAGQMHPFWKHSGKDFERLDMKDGFDLANMENVPYRRQDVGFSQGDMLFMFTRGIPKTVDAKGNEYTGEYLLEDLNAVLKRAYGVKEIVDCVLEDLQQFSGEVEQSMDRTVLLFCYFGKSG